MKVLNEIVKEEFGKRSVKDHRRRVNRLVCSYLETNGDEYRKAYEYPTTTSYDDMVKVIPRELP